MRNLHLARLSWDSGKIKLLGIYSRAIYESFVCSEIQEQFVTFAMRNIIMFESREYDTHKYFSLVSNMNSVKIL